MIDLKSELANFKPIEDIDEKEINTDEMQDIMDLLSQISNKIIK